jgi:phasin family protein
MQQDATQAAREATRKNADQAERFGRAAADANTQAARVGADIMGRNIETTHHVLQSGADMAAKIAKRSAQQFGRAFGFAGNDAEKAAQTFSTNVHAILESSATLADMAQQVAAEWTSFGRDHLERNFDRWDHLFESRTPQDLLAAQSEMMKNNLEGLLGYTRRVAEHSMRTTEELTQKFNRAAERSQPAA